MPQASSTPLTIHRGLGEQGIMISEPFRPTAACEPTAQTVAEVLAKRFKGHAVLSVTGELPLVAPPNEQPVDGDATAGGTPENPCVIRGSSKGAL